MSDPIADMFTRIRNANALKKESVDVPFSRMKYGIAKILEQKGFLKGVEVRGRKTKRQLELFLQYKEGSPAISEIKRISRPGQRIYLPSQKLRRVKGGLGLAILSTSKGLLADTEARKQNVGGEVIGQVW